MMKLLILIGMFILGAVLGSFACCQAWRWRYKIEGKKSLGKRSVCMSCKYKLKWYDNIPVISWLMLRGKCRKCGKSIGWAEILSEVGLGTAFAMLGHVYVLPMVYYWSVLMTRPMSLVILVATVVLTLIMLVVLTILSVYDAKWGELPVILLVLAVGLGAMILGLKVWSTVLDGGDVIQLLISAGCGVVIMAGVCWAIYKVSNERLMGGGDWIMALAVALAIGDWWLALWAMFMANLLGDIIMMPSLIQKGNHVIHFGPFLMIGFVMVIWLGSALPSLFNL
ncbi:prepilin peptidase [Candidatus Saccharibacteria bacterium]|nr:prepilin peptidase [Candidatus Saccharibacteria bacterium]